MVPGKFTLHGKALLTGMNKTVVSMNMHFLYFLYFDKTSWMCNCTLSLWFQEDILQVSEIKSGGGTWIIFFYPYLRIVLPQKQLILLFSKILQIMIHFSKEGVSTSKTADFTFFFFIFFFGEMGPTSKDFLTKMGPMSKDFWWKSNRPFGWHNPVCLDMCVPPN